MDYICEKNGVRIHGRLVVFASYLPVLDALKSVRGYIDDWLSTIMDDFVTRVQEMKL